MEPWADRQHLAARLFESHARAVRRYFRRHTGNPDLADDLTQDVYMRIMQAAERYEGREREAAWVFRIAHNRLVDHHRRQARLPRQADDRDIVSPTDHSVKADLKQALERLDDLDRHAFLLSELGGLRYDEVAAILGLTTAAVRSRIFRSRRDLRDMLLPPRPAAAAARVHGRSDENAE